MKNLLLINLLLFLSKNKIWKMQRLIGQLKFCVKYKPLSFVQIPIIICTFYTLKTWKKEKE